MQDLIPGLNEYCERHSTHTDPLLIQVERETHLKTLAPRMLSGHLQGSLLTMIAKMMRPTQILEIGTFTGYSALCLACGLMPNGVLTTIDNDPETAIIAQRFFDLSPQKDQIVFKHGNAKDIIPSLIGPFDLVFIDADKDAYIEYFDLIIDKCLSGALIIADNVLWSGKVLDTTMDRKTRAIDDFNKKIHKDARIENVILPIRDGLNLIRVK
jgi:caffeoyl-CoA O-methyltransferase